MKAPPLTICVAVAAIFTEFAAPARTPPSSPCAPIKLKNGRIRWRRKGQFAKFLCSTGYTLAGDRYISCIKGVWDNPVPKCVRATCKPVSPPANGQIYTSYSGAVLYFYCKGEYVARGVNTTYCDGAHWDSPKPTCLPRAARPPLFCDFETDDLCGWNHDVNHDFDWRRLNFATPSGSIGTGPSFDHSKGRGGDGYYMYIESSSRNVGDKARLISPVYDATTSNTCFEFFYHMFGASIGELRVYLKRFNQSWELEPEAAFFSERGNQGDLWHRSFTHLGPIDQDFQIVIEGVRGTSYVSDIAIDDVRIIENCTAADEDTGDFASTTDDVAPTKSTPPLLAVQSCENRCNDLPETSDVNDGRTISCDCDDACYLRSRCCPDFLDFCFAATITTTTTTTLELSERPQPSRITTQVDASAAFTSSKPGGGGPSTAAATTTTTTRRRFPVVVLKPTTPKIIYYERTPPGPGGGGAIDEARKAASDVEPPPLPEAGGDDIDDKLPPLLEANTAKSASPNGKMVIDGERPKSDEGREKESSPKLALAAAAAVTVVAVIAVAATLGVRRLGGGYSGRMKGSSNGDSQSDVRFLTGDETIDFSLPIDYSDL